VVTDLKFSTDYSEHQNYQVTITPLAGAADTSTSYLATAAPQSTQARDKCGSLSIDSRGKKLPVVSDAALNSNGSCW
jgi:type IV pilus assembly protein PilE